MVSIHAYIYTNKHYAQAMYFLENLKYVLVKKTRSTFKSVSKTTYDKIRANIPYSVTVPILFDHGVSTIIN